jgi:hypothetical protein
VEPFVYVSLAYPFLKITQRELNNLFWIGSKCLHHEYECRGVMGLMIVDAYSALDLCMPIFFGEASKQDFAKE